MQTHILVVEDEPDLEFLITRKFRRRIREGHYLFSFADNGAEALRVLAAHQDIYVVMSDIRMPVMDGLTLLNELNTHYPLLRAIIISAYGDIRNIRTAMNRGAYDFLTKPIDFTDLEATLNKTITHVQQLLHEVSARKKSEEQVLQLKKAVENMQLGVTVSDLQGRIIYTNPAEARMHGYAVADLLGADIGILAPPNLRQSVTMDEVKQWKGSVRESLNVRKDGSIFPVWLMSEIVRDADGEPTAFVTSCEDITGRKQADEELRKHRDHLEELVKERTIELTTANTNLQQEIGERKRAERALQHAKESAEDARRNAEDAQKIAEDARTAAEDANRAKSDFLANMSHELRTPLNGILGYTQILKRDLTLVEQQQDAVAVIHRSGEHLLMMINDILDLSKIEARKMDLEPHDFRLTEVLKTIVEIAKVRADQKGITLEYLLDPEIPRSVHGDEKRLRQILLNLLSNAVKFTLHGSVVFRVTRLDSAQLIKSAADVAAQRRVQIRFAVQDSGIGIPPDHLENIFAAFHQVRDERVYTEGTGLGLAISQRLVRMMGGQLAVESDVNLGSTFRFEISFPIIEETVHADDERHPQAHIIGIQGDPPTALLADDNPTNLAVLRDVLKPLGFQVLEAVNGKELVEKACARHPDLLLVDLVMPVMDGLEAVRRIRQHPALRDTAIIAISASVSPERERESLEAGCNAFLAKPFQVEALLQRIQQQMNIAWLYQEPESVSSDSAPSSTGSGTVSGELEYPPPQEDLRQLYDIAMIGQITKLRRTLDRIDAQDERYHTFVTNIRQLAKEFQIEAIQAYIERFLDGE